MQRTESSGETETEEQKYGYEESRFVREILMCRIEVESNFKAEGSKLKSSMLSLAERFELLASAESELLVSAES